MILAIIMMIRQHLSHCIPQKTEGSSTEGGSHETRNLKYTEYTPMSISRTHILEVNEKSGLFRKPYRIGPFGRKDEKYCAFHEANDHETSDYRHLKD